MLTLTATEEGIQYEAGEEVIVRILDNMDEKVTESLNILEGPGAQNKGLLTKRQFLSAVSSGDKQAAEGLAYACAYVTED